MIYQLKKGKLPIEFYVLFISDLNSSETRIDKYIIHSLSSRSEENPQSSRYIPPPRILPPEGIQDFDLENWRDPSQCSEYAQDIFQYYKNREVLKRSNKIEQFN